MSRFGRYPLLSSIVALLLLLGCVKKNAQKPTVTLQACAATERTPAPRTIEAVVRPNVVQVIGDKNVLGSGFIVPNASTSDALVVTNYHVIVEADKLELSFVRADNEHVKIGDVTVVKVSPKDDLALLRAPRLVVLGSGMEFTTDLHVGQSVVSLGYPHVPGGKAEPMLTSGLVTLNRNRFGDRDYVQTNMEVSPGASGGAAVDSCGRVVGVVAAHHSQLSHIGLLVPVEKVQFLIASYRTARPAPEAEITTKIREFAQYLQRDEGQVASAYFSRSFLATNFLPPLRNAMESIAQKRERWEIVKQLMRSRGIDPNRLTQAQVEFVAAATGVAMTREELHAYRTAELSQTQGLDMFAMLQAYLGPLLGDIFGRIDDVEVRSIRTEGETKIAHVIFRSPAGSAHYAMKFVDEMGTYAISEVRAVNRAQSPSPAPTTGASTNQLAQSQQESPWVRAARATPGNN